MTTNIDRAEAVQAKAAAIRRLVARRIVAVAYDEAREVLPFDMTASRRRRAISRLEDDVRGARRGLELDLILIAGGVELAPRTSELQAELERKAGALLAGRTPSSSVVRALQAVVEALELERPARLERLLEGAGSVYTSGGSRAGQRDRYYQR